MILVTFNPKKLILMKMDTSERALEACLCQIGENDKWRLVAFYSQKFSDPELYYNIHDKELLAIVDAFLIWQVYLEEATFKVRVLSDHKNLLAFTTIKKLNRRQTRRSELLSAYNFRIQYQKGNENSKADALSYKANYIVDNED